MTVYPCYFLIGQSNAEGNGRDTGMNSAYQGPLSDFYIWVHELDDWKQLQHDLTGDPPLTRTRWNLTTIGALFDGEDDAPDLLSVPPHPGGPDIGTALWPNGTYPTPAYHGPQIGPEMTLGHMLPKLHPEVNKVFLLKFCYGDTVCGDHSIKRSWKKGSPVIGTDPSNLYDWLTARYETARDEATDVEFIGDVTGFDIRGVFCLLGESDAAGGAGSPESGNPAAFTTNMRQLIDDFRDDFTDTTYDASADGDNPIPWIWPLVHRGIQVSTVEASPTPGGLTTVRNGILYNADHMRNVRTFDPEVFANFHVDWFGVDNDHYDAPTQETMGFLLAGEMQAMVSAIAAR